MLDWIFTVADGLNGLHMEEAIRISTPNAL
jgi:hypothetical protein